jgi:hypothetical protein
VVGIWGTEHRRQQEQPADRYQYALPCVSKHAWDSTFRAWRTVRSRALHLQSAGRATSGPTDAHAWRGGKAPRHAQHETLLPVRTTQHSRPSERATARVWACTHCGVVRIHVPLDETDAHPLCDEVCRLGRAREQAARPGAGAAARPSTPGLATNEGEHGALDKYGGSDEACPISTGEGTRRVRSVRGAGEWGRVRLTNLFDYGAEEGTVSIARGGAARRGVGELASECVVGERSHLLKLPAPPEELELSEPAHRQGWRPNATVYSARRGGGAAGRRGGRAAGRRGGGAAGRRGGGAAGWRGGGTCRMKLRATRHMTAPCSSFTTFGGNGTTFGGDGNPSDPPPPAWPPNSSPAVRAAAVS